MNILFDFIVNESRGFLFIKEESKWLGIMPRLNIFEFYLIEQ